MREWRFIYQLAGLAVLSWGVTRCGEDTKAEEVPYDTSEDDNDICHLAELSEALFPDGYTLGPIDMVVQGQSLYSIIDEDLVIHDVSSPDNIALAAGIGWDVLMGSVRGFAVSGDTIYTVNSSAVHAFNYGDKQSDPVLTESIDVIEEEWESHDYDNAMVTGDLLILSAETLEQDGPMPILVVTLKSGVPVSLVEIDVGDGHIATAVSDDGYVFGEFIDNSLVATPCLMTVDLAALDEPEVSDCLAMPGYIMVMAQRGDLLYLGFESNSDEAAVWIVDISDPMNPEHLRTLESTWSVYGLAADDNWLYAVMNNDLRVADLAASEWVSLDGWRHREKVSNVAVDQTEDDGLLYIRERARIVATSGCAR